MFCENCGKEIQGQGPVCPECAAQVAPGAENAAPQVSFGGDAPAAPVYEAPAAPIYEAPAAPAYEPVPAVPAQPTPGFTLSSPADGVKKSGKKKSKGLLIGLGIAALVLVVGIVVVALNWNNWFGGDGKLARPADIPEDPAEYIAYLHEPQMEGMAQDLSKLYSNYMGGEKLQAYEASLKLLLGDDLIVMLEDGIAESGLHMDMDWLKDIRLNISANAPDSSAVQAIMELALGETRILGLDYILDMENLVMYMGLPEVNEDYVMRDMGEALAQSGQELPLDQLMAIGTQLVEDMPSEEEVDEFLDGYTEIILSYMTNVEQTEETVTVGKAQQKVTVLTVTITEEDLGQMFEELLEYTKENKTFRQIAQAYVNYTNGYCDAGLYGEDMRVSMDDVDAFLDEGIEAFREVADQARDGNYMHLITYADGAEVVGYYIHVYVDDELERQLGYLALTHKGTIYFEAKEEGDFPTAILSGQGKSNNGKLTGEYVLTEDGDELLTLKLKDVDGETGYGVYDFIPNAELMEEVLEEMDGAEMVSVLASDLTFRIELAENKIGLELLSDEELLLGGELSVSVTEPQEVTIPKDTIDINDEAAMEEWSENISIDKILDNLKEAGLPNAIYRLLKQAIV